MSSVIDLIKAINAHGVEVEEITLEDIGTKDILELGLPTLIIPSSDGTSAGVEIRQGVIARYVVRKAKIPLSSVQTLHPADWGKCQAWCMGFFGESYGTEEREAREAPSTD